VCYDINTIQGGGMMKDSKENLIKQYATDSHLRDTSLRFDEWAAIYNSFAVKLLELEEEKMSIKITSPDIR
jgi:hypothetical protein